MRDKDPNFFFPRQSGLKRSDFKEEPWFKLDIPTAIVIGLLVALLVTLILSIVRGVNVIAP